MMITLDIEKAYDKIQKPFMKSVIQGAYLNTIKDIYIRQIANIKLNRKKLKAIPLKLETG